MKNTRKSLAAAISGAGLLLASSSGFAAVLSLSGLATNLTTDHDQNTLTFQQFNSSLGTLTGVTFSLNSTTDVTATVIGSFSSGEGGDASATTSASFDISAPSHAALFSDVGTATASCSSSSGSFCNSLFPDSVNLPSFPPSVLVTSNLSPFIGSGFFDVFATLDVESTLTTCDANSGSAICTTAAVATWDGTLDVTYQFTPAAAAAPEPATIVLVSIALATLGFSRRRVQPSLEKTK